MSSKIYTIKLTDARRKGLTVRPRLRPSVVAARFRAPFVCALALIPAAIVAVCMSVGIVLSRLDRAQLTADSARAETRLLRAELAQHAIAHRDPVVEAK